MRSAISRRFATCRRCWFDELTSQDGAVNRPHITLQNTAGPTAAQATLVALRTARFPHVTVDRLALHHRGGPLTAHLGCSVRLYTSTPDSDASAGPSLFDATR